MKLAVEVQVSKIEPTLLRNRTKDLQSAGYHPIWFLYGGLARNEELVGVLFEEGASCYRVWFEGKSIDRPRWKRIEHAPNSSSPSRRGKSKCRHSVTSIREASVRLLSDISLGDRITLHRPPPVSTLCQKTRSGIVKYIGDRSAGVDDELNGERFSFRLDSEVVTVTRGL